ncbi:MAG: hypothetical protein K0Q72_1846 [Armatimonadetes bacterium]|nr:hypothetical protein [Armatimonadota bacterium]
MDLLLAHGATAGAVGPGPWVRHPGIAGKLLSHGADVNRVPGRWIWISCTGNSGHREDVELVRALLHCGADMAAEYAGRPALFYATRAGFLQVADLPRERGAPEA